MLCSRCHSLLRLRPASCFIQQLPTGLVPQLQLRDPVYGRSHKAGLHKHSEARGEALLLSISPKLSHRNLAVRAMSSSAEGVPTVSVDEAHELLSTGATYLDVRTKEEFQNGHAKGAINVPILVAQSGGMVPNAEFTEQVAQALPDKDETIVLGCKSGRRSEMAWHVLDRQDYSSMSNIAGGFDKWLASGLPTAR